MRVAETSAHPAGGTGSPLRLPAQTKASTPSTTVPPPTMTESGTIKWFDRKKGFGFVTPSQGGEDIFVPLSFIIGGPEQAGQGWRMLMDCLDTDGDGLVR